MLSIPTNYSSVIYKHHKVRSLIKRVLKSTSHHLLLSSICLLLLANCNQSSSDKYIQEYEVLTSSASGYLVAWTNHFIKNCEPPKDIDHPGNCDHILQGMAARIDTNGTVLDPHGINIGDPDIERVAGESPIIYSFVIPGSGGYFLLYGTNGYWISLQGTVTPASGSFISTLQAVSDGLVIPLSDNQYMSIGCGYLNGIQTSNTILTQRFSADGVFIDPQPVELITENGYQCNTDFDLPAPLSRPDAALNEQSQAVLIAWKNNDRYQAIRLAADGSKLDANPFELHSYNTQSRVGIPRPASVFSYNDGWVVVVLDDPDYDLVTVKGDGTIDNTSKVGTIDMTPGSWATSNSSLFHAWTVNDIKSDEVTFPFDHRAQRFNLADAQPIDSTPLAIGKGGYFPASASDGRSFLSVFFNEDNRITAAYVSEDGKLKLYNELAPVP